MNRQVIQWTQIKLSGEFFIMVIIQLDKGLVFKKRNVEYMETIITEDAEFHLLNCDKHRDDDLPAEIWKDGTKFWFFKGQLHRNGDRPAVEWADGSKVWYSHGRIHRVNGPAAMWADGTNVWYMFGKVVPIQHRTNQITHSKMKCKMA
jgi:hypothetical protein